jgi:outer membrane lipoprotein-sorting protein
VDKNRHRENAQAPVWAPRRSHWCRRVACAAVLAFASCMPMALLPADCAAALAPDVAVNAEAAADLPKIERYLNGIHTLRAQFAQVSSNGETAQGQLYLSRPGKMRIEYRPPVPVLVVADGTFLIYYDRSLEQVSYVPLDATPASILLDKNISLADPDLLVTHFSNSGDTLDIGIVRRKNPGEGSITLTFAREPLSLQQWTVTDAQGVATIVTLLDAQWNVPVRDSLFQFEDPRKRLPDRP